MMVSTSRAFSDERVPASAAPFLFTALITGGDIAFPMVRTPSTRINARLLPVPADMVQKDNSPTGDSSSCRAPWGHTRIQPPQEWQSSGKTMTDVPTQTIALNSQNRPHSPQAVHFDSSRTGTGTVTVSVCLPVVSPRKIDEFGSSTSQSRSTSGSETERARDTDTVVLPVPPFPEATAIFISSVPQRRHCQSFAIHLFSTLPMHPEL
ncbi:MAG: hypothetical protein BWY20_02397 [Spirochaetes bacterium ADurb.Bin215]|nr:MAG: hypothetical protein BWY20_02397 [Spirochaetes bacterium ADurb.Bin215]